MKRAAITLVLVLAGPTIAQAALGILPGMPQTKPVLLSGGMVVTVSGSVLNPADVLLVDGRIKEVGTTIAPPSGAEVIDVRGKRVYPGLIAANTLLGLVEISGARQTVDIAEIGPINPNARAQTALNAESDHLPVTRANGVLTALVAPAIRGASGLRLNLIAGTSTLIRLDGWTWEDLTLRAAVAMHIYLPSMRLDRDSRNARPLPVQQKDVDSQLRMLNEAVTAARAYARARASARPDAPVDTDLRWEAMLPLLRGEQRAFVHADELKQIRAALAFARQQELSIVIVGGLDAWRVAAELKAANVAVIVTGTDRLPLRRDDDYEAAYANPARLHAAGVRFCIAGEGPGDVGKERNLGIYAGRAAAHGLPPDVALRAITLSAAEVLGVESELGSVDAGKRGTLIVTDGDPLEVSTRVHLAFIDGASVDLRSRHTLLYEKYHERLRRGKESRPASLPADGQ